MIRFLRHIRQRLMQKNKLRSYIFYSLGEITLVMIGILLALQVNNWNENHQEDKERIQLLKALKSDFIESQAIISSDINSNNERADVLLRLLEISAKGNINALSQDSLRSMLQSATIFYFFETYRTAYEEAKSSGKLALIKNQKLMMALNGNEQNLNGLKSIVVPVFGESYAQFNAQIGLMDKMQQMSEYIKAPATHPKYNFNQKQIEQFLMQTDTYEKLYHLHFLTTLEGIWLGSVNFSMTEVLKQIEISLGK